MSSEIEKLADNGVKNRVEWIDVAKGIGILSVILTHCYIPDTLTKHYLYSFHMPLFFILSGYFHKVDTHKNVIKKRFRTLIIPYIFFYITSTIIYLIATNFGKHADAVNLQIHRIVGIFYGVGDGLWMWNITLWFLVCLFIVTIFYNYLSLHINKTRNLIFLLIFSSIVGYLTSLYLPVRIPWSIDVALSAVLFYGFGALLRKNNLLERLLDLKISLLFIPVSLIVAFLNTEIDMNSNYYGNYFLFYIAGVSGTMMILIVSKKIFTNSKILQYFGKNSLIILGTHTVILMLLPGILNRFINIEYIFNDILVKGIFLFVLVVIIEIPVIIILNKYFKKFI